MLKHRNFLQKWHAKNAEGNPLRNPLFPHRGTSAKRRALMVSLGALALLLVALGVLIYGPWLRITSVVVDGLTTLPNDLVQQRVVAHLDTWKFHLFPKNTLMFFDRNELTADLLRDFQLKAVDTKYDGRTLVVTVEENILQVALHADGTTFFLNRDGSLAREALVGESVPSTIPIVNLSTHDENEALVISEAKLSGIIAIDEGLRERGITPLSHTLARLADSWITTATDQGFTIMTDVTKDIQAQLFALQSVLAERNGVTYEYIDVRFGEHVFVKEL